MDDTQYSVLSINHTQWKVPPYFVNLTPIGSGGYGAVCSATDLRTNNIVAIKKLQKAFSAQILAKRAYRELKTLRFLKHDNVIELVDMFVSQPHDSPDFDIYIVTEWMPTTLHDITRTQVLTLDHIRLIFYLIMRALVYVHSAGLLHRDLKPSNIVVDEDINLKVLDFGLARPSKAELDKTGYVTTRHYRAPEVFTKPGLYDTAMDIWSAGCILGEMLLGKSLFPGDTSLHQMDAICSVVGKPSAEYIATLDSEYAQSYVSSLPDHTSNNLRLLVQGCDAQAVDLLQRMLNFDERMRPSAQEVMQHPFLAEYHDPEDEPVVPPTQVYDDAYESLDLDTEGWKGQILDLVRDFQATKAAALGAISALSDEEIQQILSQTMDQEGDDEDATQLPELELTQEQMLGIGFVPHGQAQVDPMQMELMTPAAQLNFLHYEQSLLG
eukprot:TRINITY_DN10659_c0_g1_i4.p1 TRINITY_DN10659_c0_g1~~TRINITY_DN10659_c0_g1_i4.p1  ORF type:complete len:439 (+),score=101.08 TRINITY_DN10659_c0_g1_i4:44-1360(+)